MEEKKPFGTRLEAFFAGKGFYVVLFLCVAVIGVSAWSLISGGLESSLDSGTSMAVASIDDSYLTAGKTASGAEPAAQTKTVPEDAEPIQKVLPEEAAESAVEETPAAPAEVQTQDYYIWPVSGEIAASHTTDVLVWNPTMQDWRTHNGIDIVAELGTQVKAAANGKVTDVYEDDLYGTTVVLTHNHGLQSIYANLAATPAVNIGDQVGVGQTIGAVGDTALGEAGQVCHLHFAMTQDGESVDPVGYLP